MSEGRWVVIVEGALHKKQRDRVWRSDPVSFFEARRIAQRACKERGQPATIQAARGRKSRTQPVEIHHPDGRVERPEEERCNCVGTAWYCSHKGRCKERIAKGASNVYCEDCLANAMAESYGQCR